MHITLPDPADQDIQQAPITQARSARNGICHVDANQAAKLVGARTPGVIIPYFTFQDGQWVPIRDPGTKPYCRLRKDGVEGNGKYHQPSESGVHSYIPADLAACTYGDAFVVVEGEKKALSASDFSQGFSLPALGLSGFYGYRLKGVEGQLHQLTAECDWALNHYKTQAIAFLGDADTCFNWQFSDAAVSFRELVPGRTIILPRLPFGGTKGIDDARQELGSGFEKFCRRLLDDAVELKAGMEADQLALILLEPELAAISKLSAARKAVVTHRVVKMAAMMTGEARQQLLAMVKKPLGIGKTALEKLVNIEAKKYRETVRTERLSAIAPKVGDFVYDGRRYYRKHAGIFVPLSGDDNVKLALRTEAGLTSQTPGADPDDALGLYSIQKNNAVAWAGEVAGHSAGIHDGPAGKILITRGPTLIEGVDGDASHAVEFLSGFFGRLAGEEHWRTQFETFVGWVKQGRSAIRNPPDGLSGQAIVFVGPSDAGKTFTQRHLITPLLGGRFAEIAEYLAGQSKYNEGFVGAEHLLVADADIPPDEEVRRRIRNQIKRLVANPACMLSKKYAAQIMVEPVWRLSISANPGRNDLAILPRLDSFIMDKMIILKTYRPAKMPGADPAERREFRVRLQSALPAFVAQVDRFTISPERRDGRFGIRAFHHPEILHLMGSVDPAVRVGGFLDEYLAGVLPDSDSRTARDWHKLMAEKFGAAFLELAADPREMGCLLAGLRDTSPDWGRRISQAGEASYGDQRNYAPVWKVTRAS